MRIKLLSETRMEDFKRGFMFILGGLLLSALGVLLERLRRSSYVDFRILITSLRTDFHDCCADQQEKEFCSQSADTSTGDDCCHTQSGITVSN